MGKRDRRKLIAGVAFNVYDVENANNWALKFSHQCGLSEGHPSQPSSDLA